MAELVPLSLKQVSRVINMHNIVFVLLTSTRVLKEKQHYNPFKYRRIKVEDKFRGQIIGNLNNTNSNSRRS